MITECIEPNSSVYISNMGKSSFTRCFLHYTRIHMYFSELNLILSTCLCFSNGFSFHNFNYISRKFDETAPILDTTTISMEWIEQPLDHFNKSETRTWKMKYFQSIDKWKPRGPIFIFINGEGTASYQVLKSGIMYELAKETNGVMFTSEHRYYGNSKPFNDFTSENLQYLSSRQALADIARLIRKIKKLPLLSSSKVVVVGGSYAGNLAAWMKLIYPDLIDAAIASSGPVLAKADFFEYLDTVSDDFEQYGTPKCYGKIVEIFKRYDEMFKSERGIEKLKKEENICEYIDMTKLENKELFFNAKISSFISIAQYGNPDKIKMHCHEICNSSKVFSTKDDETDLWNERKNCFDYEFTSMIKGIKINDAYYAWMYQTCTEFGYYQITAVNQPFTDNVHIDYYYKMCTELFGPNFNGARVEESIKKSNEMYGGLNPNVTKVVFVNGDLDPWHRLSVLKDISFETPAIIIPRSSHCMDLFSNEMGDPEELKRARAYIKYLIKKWIGVIG